MRLTHERTQLDIELSFDKDSRCLTLQTLPKEENQPVMSRIDFRMSHDEAAELYNELKESLGV